MFSSSDSDHDSTPAIPTAVSARVLIVHNRYRQPGGEDSVADAQAHLLSDNGHAVRRYERTNTEIDAYSLLRKARLFFETTHNPASARDMARLVRDFKPHVAHIHNTLPLISPSIYKPLNDAGVKTIQWLHNFRLVCPAGTLYRSGAPCTLCLNGDFAPALKYRCWTGSRMATRALVRALNTHRRKGTWRERIDLFVALNSYQKKILVESGGIPEEKIIVQPNFIDAPALEWRHPIRTPGEFLFIGRLTPEKGVLTLLKAMEQVRGVPIAIAGAGPLSHVVERTCAQYGHTWLGQLPRSELRVRLASARAMIFASEWPEGCPTVILEALSCGVPVIASSVPGAAELLKEGQNALFFPPGNLDALADCIIQLASDPRLEDRLSRNALQHFNTAFSREAGYKHLLQNYARLGIETEP